MAANTNDYELPTSNAYEELHVDMSEQSCYSSLTYTTRDDVIGSVNHSTTSISGSGPIRQGHVGNKQNTELSRKEETSRPLTIVFAVALILITVTIVGLVAWNVYLSLAFKDKGSDEQVQVYETVTLATSTHAADNVTLTVMATKAGDTTGFHTASTPAPLISTSIRTSTEDLGQTPQMSPLMCPRGWKRYQSSCYLFISERLSFIDAMVFCQTMDGHLVYIETESEKIYVRDECKKRKPVQYLIGLTDIEKEGDWVWVGTGTVTNFTDWAKGEPNRGTTANCVVLWEARDYHWADDLCVHRQSFICEKDVG